MTLAADTGQAAGAPRFVVFVLIALALHLAAFALVSGGSFGGPNGAGEGGFDSVSLAASDGALRALVADWERPPTLDEAPATLPEPAAPLTAPAPDLSPEVALSRPAEAPQAPAAMALPAPVPDAPPAPVAAPAPPRAKAPPAKPKSAKPQRSAPPEAAAAAPAAPAAPGPAPGPAQAGSKAAGAGGGPAAGVNGSSREGALSRAKGARRSRNGAARFAPGLSAPSSARRAVARGGCCLPSPWRATGGSFRFRSHAARGRRRMRRRLPRCAVPGGFHPRLRRFPSRATASPCRCASRAERRGAARCGAICGVRCRPAPPGPGLDCACPRRQLRQT